MILGHTATGSVRAAATVHDLHATRRRNLLDEFQRFASQAVVDGLPHSGLELRFAQVVGITSVQFSRHKGGHLVIGDRLARRFEGRLQKPVGWLDEQHASDGMTPEESTQVADILALYRRMNRTRRRQLRDQLAAWSASAGDT